MNIENRATTKRIITLLCSMGTIVCYGYLIGGVGGYLFGKGRPILALCGFLSGTILAGIALRIWKSYLVDVELLNEADRRTVSVTDESATEKNEP